MLSLYLSPFLTVYALTLTLLLGASVGSFAVCLAQRLAAGLPFLNSRSRCDACGETLRALELIPIFSWLWQRGRCRRCGAAIPLRCLLIELLCAGLFAALVLYFDLTLQTLQYLILTTVLLVLALVDFDAGIIPNGLNLAIFIIWLVFLPFTSGGNPAAAALTGLMGALAASAPLLALSLIMDRLLGRDSLGGGDIKLFFAAGWFFSAAESLFLLILSCILGIIFALLSGKTTRDPANPAAFPFGPAIAAAVYLALFAAAPAVGAWLSLFS